MYKILTFIFKVLHLHLFMANRIKGNFTCGKSFLFKNKGDLSIGDGVVFRNFVNILIEKNGYLEIGSNVFINNYSSFNVCKRLTIGNDCLFGEGVKIYDHNHIYRTSSLVRNAPLITKDIVIGNNVWICSNVVICAGVVIGDNCVIGANSVVFKDIPENSVYCCDGSMRQIDLRK